MAFALFIVGVIVTVKQHSSHKSILNLLLRLLLLTSLLVFLPAWGNTLQNLLQTSILSGLGVDPANVYQQFNHLLIIKRDPATQSSWWNVMSQLHNFTTDLIISAVLWLVGQFASLMMFWAYIFQTIILNLGYALSPLLIGFMAIPALKHTGNRYLMNLVGVLLWPLGWALAALVTQGILDFMTDPSFEYIDPTSTLARFAKDHRRRRGWLLDNFQHRCRARHHPKCHSARHSARRRVARGRRQQFSPDRRHDCGRCRDRFQHRHSCCHRWRGGRGGIVKHHVVRR